MVALAALIAVSKSDNAPDPLISNIKRSLKLVLNHAQWKNQQEEDEILSAENAVSPLDTLESHNQAVASAENEASKRATAGAAGVLKKAADEEAGKLGISYFPSLVDQEILASLNFVEENMNRASGTAKDVLERAQKKLRGMVGAYDVAKTGARIKTETAALKAAGEKIIAALGPR